MIYIAFALVLAVSLVVGIAVGKFMAAADRPPPTEDVEKFALELIEKYHVDDEAVAELAEVLRPPEPERCENYDQDAGLLCRRVATRIVQADWQMGDGGVQLTAYFCTDHAPDEADPFEQEGEDLPPQQVRPVRPLPSSGGARLTE